MKRSIKILIAMIIMFITILITKSNAALDAKYKGSGDYPTSTSQRTAYGLCYDMRNPTSSLGSNSLDPHLSSGKDFGAWTYLGMSAYGSNGAKTDYDGQYTTSNGNKTGVFGKRYNSGNEVVAAILDQSSDTYLVKKNGKTKYLDILESTELNNENTRGMAITETAGWYGAPYFKYIGISTSYPVIHRISDTNTGTYLRYGCEVTQEDNWGLWFRPVIWN